MVLDLRFISQTHHQDAVPIRMKPARSCKKDNGRVTGYQKRFIFPFVDYELLGTGSGASLSCKHRASLSTLELLF